MGYRAHVGTLTNTRVSARNRAAVAQVPGRVPEVSATYRGHGVQHEPGLHTPATGTNGHAAGTAPDAEEAPEGASDQGLSSGASWNRTSDLILIRDAL